MRNAPTSSGQALHIAQLIKFILCLSQVVTCEGLWLNQDMKILLLNDRIPPEGKGGAEAVVWRLAQGLTEAGHEAHVATTTDGDACEEIRAGIPTYHLRARYPERFRAWLSLWNPQTVGAFGQLLRRIQPDVVNAHNIHSFLSYHTLKMARDAGCGVVFSAHDAMTFAYGKLPSSFAGGRPEHFGSADIRVPRGYNLRQNRFRYNPFRNRIIKRCLERNSHFRTAPSQALADAFVANDMPPVSVVHNGIDVSEWLSVEDTIVADLRRRLDLEEKQVILIAGRLTAEKGLRQMLMALHVLHQQFPQLRLLLLTSRDLDKQVSQEFAQLRHAICMGGWLSGDELRAAYQLADVVAAPSIYIDPFPTVVLEAMAAGKAVVATGFGGAREAVVDGETGYIVNPFDTDAFAEGLERLLRDSGLRREMGWRGRERVRRCFSLEQQVAKMEAMYDRSIELAAERAK